MSKTIKWVDVEIDADVIVEGEELASPAAAVARFDMPELASRLGWAPGKAGDDEAVGLALMMIERVAEALKWQEDPWVACRVEGASARARMSPGRIDERSWSCLVEAFAGVCVFYGNPGAKSAMRTSVEGARRLWLDS